MDYDNCTWGGSPIGFDKVSVDTVAVSSKKCFNLQVFLRVLRPFLLCDENIVSAMEEDKGFNYYEKSVTLYAVFGEKTRDKLLKVGYTQNGFNPHNKKYNDGFVVHVYGKGCAQIDVVPFLQALLEAKHDIGCRFADDLRITRLDVAYDCMKGQLKLTDIVGALSAGAFNTRGFAPRMRIIMNQSFNKSSGSLVHNNLGDTIEIGSKKSLNGLVIYEKGCEQKTEEGRSWVRLELRLKADRTRPLSMDILNTFETLLFQVYANSKDFFYVKDDAVVSVSDDVVYIQKIKHSKKVMDYSKIQTALSFFRRNYRVLQEILFNPDESFIEKLVKDIENYKVSYHKFVYS